MFKSILSPFFYLLIFSLLCPISLHAKQGSFSNQVQFQSLSNLSDIIDDSTRMNLKRSSQSLNLTLNRLYTATQQLQALGNVYTKPTARDAYRPYAFIQSSTDRRKLIKHIKDLIQLHQQYSRTIHSNNKAQQKKLKSSFFHRNAKLRHIKFKWRKK